MVRDLPFLHMAAMDGDIEMIELLLKFKSNLQERVRDCICIVVTVQPIIVSLSKTWKFTGIEKDQCSSQNI